MTVVDSENMIFITIKPFSEPSCTGEGGGVIREETTPTGIELIQSEELLLYCFPVMALSKQTSGCKTVPEK